jgi:hypothetical protein
MSAAEIETAAARDHENPPLTEAKAGQLRPVPRVKTPRRALALTQEGLRLSPPQIIKSRRAAKDGGGGHLAVAELLHLRSGG